MTKPVERAELNQIKTVKYNDLSGSLAGFAPVCNSPDSKDIWRHIRRYSWRIIYTEFRSIAYRRAREYRDLENHRKCRATKNLLI